MNTRISTTFSRQSSIWSAHPATSSQSATRSKAFIAGAGPDPKSLSSILAGASIEPKSNTAGLRVDLNVNFRSVKPILDFANKVFGRIMTAPFAGIDYDESAQLKPHSQDTAKPKFLPPLNCTYSMRHRTIPMRRLSATGNCRRQ